MPPFNSWSLFSVDKKDVQAYTSQPTLINNYKYVGSQIEHISITEHENSLTRSKFIDQEDNW